MYVCVLSTHTKKRAYDKKDQVSYNESECYLSMINNIYW